MTATKRPFPSDSPEIRLCKRHKNSHESGIATSSAQSEPAQEAIPPKLAGIKRTSSEGFQENEENQENAKRRKPNMLYIESNDEAPSKEATPKSSDNNGCMECFKSCAEEIGLSSTRESLATLDEATQINEQRVEALQEEEEEEDEEGGENGEDAADDGMSDETDIASTPELSEDDSSDETSSVATDGSEVWPSDSSDNSDYSGDEDDSEGDDESISSSESEVWSSDTEEMLVLKEDPDAEEEMLILKEYPDAEEEMLILKEDPDSEDEVLSCPTCNGTGVVQKVRARYASLPLRPDQYPDHSYGDPSIATHSGLSRVHHEAKMAADANYRRRFHGEEQVEVPSLPTAGEVLLLTIMASLLVLFILLLLSRDASPDAPKTDFLTLPPA